MVGNNMSEYFNASILQARFKPIVSMLDDIRKAAIKRLALNKLLVQSWISDWSPHSMAIFQENCENACVCEVLFNSEAWYEVSDRPDRHTICLDKKMYTCKA